MQWERARTVVRCLECDTVSLPRTVRELAAEQQQRDSERAALAVRADPAAEHRAALELAAERERLCDAAATLIGWLDPAGLPPGQARQLAAGYVGQFRHLTGMAQRAASTGELDAVRDLLGQVADNVAGQRHIIDTARDAARGPAQLEAPGVIDAEWDEDEEEWEDEREAPDPVYRPGMAYSATAAALAQLEADAARRQRNGVCQIRHGIFTRQTIATREYGPVVPDPYLRHGSNVMFAPNGPRIRCCDRHGADAERAILEDGWTNVGYEVLP